MAGDSWSACAQACAENDDSGLPLHHAVEYGASAAVVGRLLQHHPHAAAAKVYYGLPLHLALGAGRGVGESEEVEASCEAIGMILAAHPQVRTAQPREGGQLILWLQS